MIRALLFFFTIQLLTLSGVLQATGLTFPIHTHDGQNIETCSGFFTDSGGDTLTPYMANEQYSITFTRDEAGVDDQELYLRIYFSFFELGSGDFLFVYDGPDENAPQLAAATGSQLAGQEIWSSGASLHFRFESSPSDTARGWWAEINCFELCDAMHLDVDSESGSFDFCPDIGPVTFTAQAEYLGGDPQGDASRFWYQWSFEDVQLEGSTVTHTFMEPGAYPFRLLVTDTVNNCQMDTIKTVRLATVPHFENTMASADTVCAREDITLIGSTHTIPWTGFPAVVDTLTRITEGQPFISSLNFDVFEDEAQIVFMDDFDRVCINIEHVDHGHLQFSLQCPNGTAVLLDDFGPGGSNLGEPVIYHDDVPGRPYEYCFTVSPQYGTMAETTPLQHEYSDPAGNYYFGARYLPAGAYTPVESFDKLIGCPLNGEWTLTITDEIMGVSGHVMGWSLFFHDDFYPDSLIFTPEIVDEQWFDHQGNLLNGNPATVSREEEGDYNFTFSATDSFGCQWDTTLTVTVLPLPEAEIVSELEIPVCEGDSTLLSVEALFAGEEIHWVYQWMVQGTDLPESIYDTLMAKEPMSYMVRVTDTLTGCFDFFELAVTDQNCDLNIPNVFTPNNDGINDFFEIENLEHYPGSVMVIYTRSGRKVFEHNDYYGNWWDGGNHPDGTYYYVLTYSRQGKKRSTQGVITIIR